MTATRHLTDSAYVDGPELDRRYQDARDADYELSERLGIELLTTNQETMP